MLDSEKGVDAKLYVWVYDHHIAEGDGFRPADDRDELVEEPRDRTRYLEEESCRKTHLLAALECIPAIEAPQAAPGSPEVSDGTHGSTSPLQRQQEQASRPQEERPSWWTRIFGP